MSQWAKQQLYDFCAIHSRWKPWRDLRQEMPNSSFLSPEHNTHLLLLLFHLSEEKLGVNVALLQKMLESPEAHLLGIFLPRLSSLRTCTTPMLLLHCTTSRDNVSTNADVFTSSIISFSFFSPSSMRCFSSSSISLVMSISPAWHFSVAHCDAWTCSHRFVGLISMQDVFLPVVTTEVPSGSSDSLGLGQWGETLRVSSLTILKPWETRQ